MVTINNFEVLANGKLAIAVETLRQETIKSILIWSMYDFKDYTKAISLNDLILGINNTESILINPDDYGIDVNKELLFMEVTDSTEGCNGANAVTYNFSNFNKCLLEAIFKEYNVDDINSGCGSNLNTTTSQVALISTLLDAAEKSLILGMYSQSISLIEKLRKLCSSFDCGCSGQKEEVICVPCSQFRQF